MNPRQYALNVLEQVVVNHGYANLLLRKQMDFSVQDMGLISEIVYGTLRNYTWLEYQWKHFAKSVRPKTAVLLNMSVYQMLYLDKVPDYAVINEAVEMSSKKDKSFVNAVLRKVQKQQERAIESTDEIETAALRFSHPLWLLKLWSAHYGKETALKIAEHDQTRGQVYGRINTLKITKEELQKDERVHFLNDISFTFDGNLTDTDWFRNGQVIIQDIASAMIPEYLEAEPGMRVLDVCAAPGTKTQEIAMLMKDTGRIDACDLYEHRVELISRLMERTGVSIVNAQVRDGTQPAQDVLYDRILADVPCSGLGDLRGKPEIRLHTSPEDLDELAVIQKKILAASAQSLKPGGILVYSTCTLNRKENENQIALFLKEHPEFTLMKEKTFFPFELNSDGFYVAQLKKTDRFMLE